MTPHFLAIVNTFIEGNNLDALYSIIKLCQKLITDFIDTVLFSLKKNPQFITKLLVKTVGKNLYASSCAYC